MTDRSKVVADLVAAATKAAVEDARRVLVLDDDPTGSQAASDVSVLLTPDEDNVREFLAGGERSAYVLTNTRAVEQSQAIEIVRCVREAAEGADVAMVLRGDSTLRGHVIAELDALATRDSVALFVPAFPEGGRHTVDGVHYLAQQGRLVPVSETEFARDPVFGYRGRTLRAWFAEVAPGRAVRTIDLAALRTEGPAAVEAALLESAAGTVVVPDADDVGDVATIVLGLLQAEQRGRHVVTRSAATLAALRAGAWTGSTLPGRSPASGGRTLVVCGSHTAAASAQLAELERLVGPAVVLSTDEVLRTPGGAAPPSVVEEVRARLRSDGIALIATERERRAEHSTLATGARLMAALTAAVAHLAHECDTVVAKGGITSAEVARIGLGAKSARVLGQIRPGVSWWLLSAGVGRAALSYVVVPGNVGTDSTLVAVCDWLGIL